MRFSVCDNFIITRFVFFRIRLPAAELEVAVIYNVFGHHTIRAVGDIDDLVDRAERRVGVCHHRHCRRERHRVAVVDLGDLLRHPHRFQRFEVDVVHNAAARAEQPRGIEPRYVREIIRILVLSPRKLPADEVISLLSRHWELLIFRVRLDGKFLIQSPSVEFRGYGLGLVGLIKIHILGDRRGIIEPAPFVGCFIPINALVKFEVFQLRGFDVRGKRPVLDNINRIVGSLSINVCVEVYSVIMQNIEIHKISSYYTLPRTDGQELEIAAVIQREHLRTVQFREKFVIIPLQRIAVFCGIFNVDALGEVEIVQIADFRPSAQIAAGDLNVQESVDKRILVFRVTVFHTRRGRLKRNISIFVR